MTFNYEDRFPHKYRFEHLDPSFINNIYHTPINDLIQMDKDSLRYSLARARLVCRWLDGILDFIADLDEITPKREGN
jgi:hypothetical protein